MLPLAFPEGSPTHPAYGAGHATVAGACVTILKAWFDEAWVIPEPVVPDAEGTKLVQYNGADAGQMTVGGELNKIAANISIARNGAGVHWRSDYTESLKLGEQIAIGILQEQSLTFNEDNFFNLTKFDGQKIKISRNEVKHLMEEKDD
ncbi:putative vanadium-dependent bromoperoxidase [Nostoc commune NIES-4072]|uniref:Putative vanadium-dependent bromoperoxidase n=1 Tax=Nostoc commune NIES-4072 TaxID=2005467 RepID=A0A2R5FML2_NOSCO|nr:vanadium-dependent haloperoxidase [Nostoc commune]BBD69474.1 putative vanadium-dependent bromoperoxidase [Nostoc commune HK-02]GBG19525.1 putative vanadium-dependent bromoperoxidase [Nostoc commune NIES-4072]